MTFLSFLRTRAGLLPLLILLFTVPAFALQMDLNSDYESGSNAERLLDVFESERSATRFSSPERAIDEAPLLALQRLDEYFRATGDIRALGQWAPVIGERLENNPTTAAMEALAAADAGKPGRARALLKTAEAATTERGYARLAQMQMALQAGEAGRAMELGRALLDDSNPPPYAAYLLGRSLLAQGQMQGAARAFERAAAAAPRFVAAGAQAGAAWYLAGNFETAATTFDRVVAAAPDFCAARIGRALNRRALGNETDAAADLRHCLTLQPGHAAATRNMLDLLVETGQLDAARALLEDASALGVEEIALGRAEIALRQARYADALKLLNELEAPVAAPVDSAWLTSLAHAGLRQWPRAIAAADTALESGSVGAIELARVLYQWQERGELDQAALANSADIPAREQFTELVRGLALAAEDAPAALQKLQASQAALPGFSVAGVQAGQLALTDKAAAALALGLFFEQRGMADAASDQFAAAVAAAPDSPLAHYFVGQSLMLGSKHDAAMKQFERSVALAPAFFTARYALAELQVARGDVEAALRHYAAAAKTLPVPGVLVRLGLLQERAGDLDAAADTWKRLIAEHPDNYIGYNQLAWLFARQGARLDHALELAREADRLQPDNAGINDTLGWIAWQQGDLERARQRLTRANTVARGGNAEVLYHLAVVEEARGATAEALVHVERALALEQPFAARRNAVALRDKLAGSR